MRLVVGPPIGCRAAPRPLARANAAAVAAATGGPSADAGRTWYHPVLVRQVLILLFSLLVAAAAFALGATGLEIRLEQPTSAAAPTQPPTPAPTLEPTATPRPSPAPTSRSRLVDLPPAPTSMAQAVPAEQELLPATPEPLTQALQARLTEAVAMICRRVSEEEQRCGTATAFGGQGDVVLTAHHTLTDGAGDPYVLWDSGAWSWAQILETRPEADLALVGLHHARGVLELLEAGPGQELERGATVHMAGYLGSQQGRISFTSGLFEGAHRLPDYPEPILVARAEAGAGMSGGPVVDGSGRLVGLLVARQIEPPRVLVVADGSIPASWRTYAWDGRKGPVALGPSPATRPSPTAEGDQELAGHIAALEGVLGDWNTWWKGVNAQLGPDGEASEGFWEAMCGQGWFGDRLDALVGQMLAMQKPVSRALLRQEALTTARELRQLENVKAEYCAAPEDGGDLLGDDALQRAFLAQLRVFYDAWGRYFQATELP